MNLGLDEHPVLNISVSQESQKPSLKLFPHQNQKPYYIGVKTDCS